MWNRLFDACELFGIAILDFDGSIRRCNAEFARILHDDRTHIIGRNSLAYTAPADRERSRENLQAIHGGRASQISFEKSYVTTAGDYVRAKLQWLAIVPDGSAPAAVLSLVHELGNCPQNLAAANRRIEQLEELLGLVLKNQQTVTVNMTGTDHSQTAIADNQSQATVTSNNASGNTNTQTALVAIIALLTVAILGLAAFVFGGGLQVKTPAADVSIDGSK